MRIASESITIVSGDIGYGGRDRTESALRGSENYGGPGVTVGVHEVAIMGPLPLLSAENR